MNPLLSGAELPRYDEIQPGHVAEAVERMIEEVEKGLARIEADTRPPSWSTVVEELNTLEEWFTRVWSPVGHLNTVKNSPELREVYQAAQPKVVALGLKMSQSAAVYARLLAIKDGPGWNALDKGQRRAIEKSLLSAKLSGIALEGAKRERFNKIAEELSQLSTRFSNNVLDATKEFKLTLTSPAEVDGLTDSAKEMLAHSYARQNPPAKPDPANGPWLLTLDAPVYVAFMQFGKNRALREKLYRAFVSRASAGEKDNTPLMADILRLRREEAELLGYANYAEVSLATKMARSPAEVLGLLEELRQASLEPARAELAEITALANAEGHPGALNHWDVSYWGKRLEEKKYGYTDDQLRPYFSLEKVLSGMFSLVGKIFGVTVKPADGEARIWNPDVRFFKMFDKAGKHIASFYLDAYSRPENKRGGAWMNDVVGRRVAPGVDRLPVAHLVCNFTPPVGDKPSLLSFDEVTTMFHEFGHGLQHMLTRVTYPDVAGIGGVEWDAVELPSQFMENWCYHRETLLGMAKHYLTGETLPVETFEKIRAAKTYRAGMIMLRQLNFGLTDMALHTAKDPDIKAVEAEVAAKTSVIPPLPEDRFLCGFTHVFSGGYAAGYYSYKWAEVLSADAFEAFEEAGLDDPEALAATGARFRETVLGLGGSEHPAEVFKAFRGRAHSARALLRHNGLLKE
ncbi:MAG: peptidase M3 [Elusimicrobia bacterium GWA2_64_40]|nr:MAG: peptidase M3 [Elusimicrobia bacterium GWA2_64_40]OGR67980.1 MAG: peptidase M3 [Elusimicrobia bacterium GWB2_63_16]